MAASETLAGECAGHTVVVLDCELDATGSGQIETFVSDVVAAGRSVIVDLAGLDYMDCAAPVLSGCVMPGPGAGADVLLAAPGGAVVRLLTVTGTAGPARVHATVAAPVAATRNAAGQYRTGRPAVVPVRRGRAASSGTDPV